MNSLEKTSEQKEERYRSLYDDFGIGGSVQFRTEDIAEFVSESGELVNGIVVKKKFDHTGCDLKVAVGDTELYINAEKVC